MVAITRPRRLPLFNSRVDPSIVSRRWFSRRRLRKILLLLISAHLFLTGMLANNLAYQRFLLDELPALFQIKGRASRGNVIRIPRIYRRARWRSLSTHGDIQQTEYRERELESMDDFYREHLRNMTKHILLALPNATRALSCEWRNNNSYTIHDEDCQYLLEQDIPQTGTIVLFNPLDQERIVCDGSRISPNSFQIIAKGGLACARPSRLFPTVPTLSTKQELEPMDVSYHFSRSDSRQFLCDVPCFSNDRMGILDQRNVKTTPFVIVSSMEGPQYHDQLILNPQAHHSHHFYSTTSFNSQIPLPYFSWAEYGEGIRGGTPVDYKTAIKGAVFMARNCDSKNNREGLVQELMDSQRIRVDSVSGCLHNAETPHGETDKLDIMKQYLFYLAFENQCEPDYVTEKLWGALSSGTVVVYYGAQNILDLVPPHSLIDAKSFNTTNELADYLHKVANNQSLYESFQEWRSKPLPESFVRKYNFTHTHSTCRTCRWAFAKKYGLGWNHDEQTVEDLYIPRKTCHDGDGVLTHPFRETWLSDEDHHHSTVVLTSSGGNVETCVSDGDLHLKKQLDHDLHRTIQNYDGVTDVFLTSARPRGNLVLRMGTSVTGSDQSLRVFSERQYWFQDANKRMTILTSADTSMTISSSGILELRISSIAAEIQIRVIVENVDQFYPDGANYTNYFGGMMTEDFFNPMESFVVWGDPEISRSWSGQELTNVGIIGGSEEPDDPQDPNLSPRSRSRKAEPRV